MLSVNSHPKSAPKSNTSIFSRSALSKNVFPEQIAKKEQEKPQRRRRVRRKKSIPNQSSNTMSSDLDSKKAAPSLEPDTRPSVANLNNATVSKPMDKLDAGKESSLSASAETDSSVTIVGSNDQVKNTDRNRRGWWQKLVE